MTNSCSHRLSLLGLRAQDSGYFLVSTSAHCLQKPDNHLEHLEPHLWPLQSPHAPLTSKDLMPSTACEEHRSRAEVSCWKPPVLLSSPLNRCLSSRKRQAIYPMQKDSLIRCAPGACVTSVFSQQSSGASPLKPLRGKQNKATLG